VRTEIINSENVARKAQVDELLLRTLEALNITDSIEPDDLESLIGEIEEYKDEFPETQEVSNKLKEKLNGVLINDSVRQLRSKFEIVKSSFGTELWNDEVANNLFEDLEVHREVSSDANILYDELKQLILRRHYVNSLDEMSVKIQNISNLTNDLALQVIPIIRTELSALILEIKSADSKLNGEENRAQILINEIQKKQNEIEKNIVELREKAIASYNKWALKVIEESRAHLLFAKDQKGVFGNKELYRNELVALFDSLLHVEANFLFDPVRSVYHEVYGEIMSDLEPENKFEVAKKALVVKKRTLDTFIDGHNQYLAEGGLN
jgi:predicted oxidoreductase (fatty acid repression mutant protein)